MATSKVQVVKIEASKVNKYSTIVRACMTASNAAAELHEYEMHEVLENLMRIANSCRQSGIKANLQSGPAQG